MSSASGWFAIGVVAFGGVAGVFAGCSTSSTAVGSADGGAGDAGGAVDADALDTGIAPGADGGDAAAVDASIQDAGTDAPPVVNGMAIVSAYGTPLGAAPGDAVPLKVVFTLSDGTTLDLPAGSQVTWIAPQTIAAQDPASPQVDDAGDPVSVLPDAGATPTAFYVSNAYRPDRTDYAGLLFVLSAGSGAEAGITVTVQLADAGVLSAVVPIAAAPVGDPDAGGELYQQVVRCNACHGQMGEGSAPSVLADGGVVYPGAGGSFPFPAPGLNGGLSEAGTPNLAADPAWNAPLLGIAAQGDLDNFGVALRAPMPDWRGKTNLLGNPLTAQDFADLYAWLQTQPTQ